MTRQRESAQGTTKPAGEAPHERVMSGCAAPTLASSSQQPAMPGHAEGALSKQPTAPRTRKPTPTLSGLPVELKQLILDELVSSVRKYESEARDDDDPDGDRYEVMFPNSGFNKSVRRGLASLSTVSSEWNALCSRHCWAEIALSRASLDSLRFFVLEILPRHADSIRCLDMRLTACENPNGVESDLGKTCTMSVGVAERKHGGAARKLRAYVGSGTEEKLLAMHRKYQLDLAGLKPSRRYGSKHRQAFKEARAQVNKQLERGERHNMFFEVLKAAIHVEALILDAVPFALDDYNARHAGTPTELPDVLVDKAETLHMLEIRVAAPFSFGHSSLAKALEPLQRLKDLAVSHCHDPKRLRSRAYPDATSKPLDEVLASMRQLKELTLNDCSFVGDGWAPLRASPRSSWSLTALTLTDLPHCTFDVLHAIIDGCAGTLDLLELKRVPPALTGARLAPIGPAQYDRTALMQTTENVERLPPTSRSLAKPLAECKRLKNLTIATEYNGSFSACSISARQLSGSSSRTAHASRLATSSPSCACTRDSAI